jgi:hypothetical protein
MTFGGEIKRMEITQILVFSTPMNGENLSEFVHFISNHCQLHNKVVSANTLLCKCFYGNDRKD